MSLRLFVDHCVPDSLIQALRCADYKVFILKDHILDYYITLIRGIIQKAFLQKIVNSPYDSIETIFKLGVMKRATELFVGVHFK